MVIYFSGTGNSEYIAKNLAEATEEKAYSMTEVDPEELALAPDEKLGIVTPVYFGGLPTFVKEFLQNMVLTADAATYVYGVVTYGGFSGQAGRFLKEAVEDRGWELCATFGVKMPDNYTVMFDCTDTKKIERIHDREQAQINSIAYHIQHENEGDYVKRKLPGFIVKWSQQSYEKARKTSHFHVEENFCNGCGLCARECPLKVIQMHDKKPDWVRGKCTLCLRCLHHCPLFAIQYDDKTKQHGQYVHP